MSGSNQRIMLGAVAAFGLLAGGAQAQKICIDPGHGGTDPGGTGNGGQEKVFVLDTANRLKSWLDLDSGDSGGGGSWTVIRTRTTDVYVGLTARADYANSNGANRFMSIHSNAFGTASANGIETFSVSSTGTGADLRNKVYEEALAMWPLTARGAKTANYTVLTATNMPAELHEMAFITNTADFAYLNSSTHRDNHARSEMYGVQRHYGQAKYTPGSAVVVTTDNASGSFTPGTGWWSSSSTPGYYGSNYHTRGTEAISDASTFNFNLPSSGSYKVEAWWSAGANRSATTPYLIYHSGGTATVNANQQINGGKWNTLGTYSFGSGNQEVKVSCWTTAGYYVIADAVRLTKQ